jgi:hypothetical protein
MSKEKKGAEIMSLATTTPTSGILDAINAQLTKLDHITESNYKTSGELEGFGNIRTEVKIENLIRAWSSVKNREITYVDAAGDLGKTTFPVFQINGQGAAAWKEDIILRMAIIEHDSTKKKLEEFKTRAESYLSEQDKKELMLKEMAAFAATLGE